MTLALIYLMPSSVDRYIQFRAEIFERVGKVRDVIEILKLGSDGPVIRDGAVIGNVLVNELVNMTQSRKVGGLDVVSA